MPNWVYNSIVITGTNDNLKSFLAKAESPRPWGDEDQEDAHFSFWNFITPPQDKLDLYFETNGSHKDEITGEIIRTGDTPYNWYNWNRENWGCKWDASEVEIEENEDGTLLVQFSTAWDKPEPVFEAMAQQHPELIFDFEWEEEQGWGGKAIGAEGKYRLLTEWDIPSSHADYIALGRLHSCNCHQTEEDYWYNDCPRVSEDAKA